MRSLPAFLLMFVAATGYAQTLPHHQLKIVLHPERHSLAAEDRITLPPGTPRILDFVLHRDLHPAAPDAEIRAVKGAPEDWLQQYLSLIHISEPTRRTPISYAVFCLKKKKHNGK